MLFSDALRLQAPMVPMIAFEELYSQAGFGPYGDACPARAPMLWHSVLAPMMNMGLVTAAESVSRIMAQPDVPIASRDGFIRQVIGWREFIRAVDLRHGAAGHRGRKIIGSIIAS